MFYGVPFIYFLDLNFSMDLDFSMLEVEFPS
jgi:hypothetical protein